MNPWNVLFPFQKYMKNFTAGTEGKDMESFMSNMFNNWQKSGYNNQANTNNTSSFFEQQSSDYEETVNPIDASVFETHTDVYVRIPIQDRSSMQNMKIYHTSNTSIVEGYPTKEDRHVLTLPSIVKKKGATAQYRDGTLEIRLAKATDLQYSEINVTEL
ncbi:hypothetical protein [Bacillus massiliigorillae]|uniref:hypothetical protein n=1 Tax=Bacillus massiliigorillae TaxID=1243664 RepID=UPI0003A0FEB1|nr:hypothetical protein [Bacillus massiliigorillae]